MNSKKPTTSQYKDKNEYQRQYRKLNPDKVKEYASRRDPERTRETAWLRRYGLSKNDYYSILLNQNGSCAICDKDNVERERHTHFHVDHNHKTGKVRGLLCDKCNRGLGYFNDAPETLRKAATYLDENN